MNKFRIVIASILMLLISQNSFSDDFLITFTGNTMLRNDAGIFDIDINYSKASEDTNYRLRYSSHELDKGFQKIKKEIE